MGKNNKDNINRVSLSEIPVLFFRPNDMDHKKLS